MKDFFKTNIENFNFNKYDFEELKTISTLTEFYFVDSGFYKITNDFFIVKCAFVLYEELERKDQKVSEFLIRIDNDKIVDFYEITKNEFTTFIKNKIKTFSVEDIENIVIEFIESFAKSGSIIVRDGSLDQIYSNREDLLLIGFAKSTEKYEKLLEVLQKYDNKKMWFCEIDEEEKFVTYFSKLHNLSKKCFRIDILKRTGTENNKILGYLAAYCADPVFLGYPYGLIQADSYARVNDLEANYYKVLYEQYSKKELIKNSHDILDKISF